MYLDQYCIPTRDGRPQTQTELRSCSEETRRIHFIALWYSTGFYFFIATLAATSVQSVARSYTYFKPNTDTVSIHIHMYRERKNRSQNG